MNVTVTNDNQEASNQRRTLGFAKVFAIRPFRWFWISQTVSVLGDRVYTVALPFLIFSLGGDAKELGRLLAAFTLTQLLSLVFLGVLVDRYSRRNMMLLVNVLRFVLLLVPIGLLLIDGLLLWHLYPLAAIFGICSAVFTPSSTSFVPEVVPKEGLSRASALRSLSQQLSSVLGPPLGGFLVGSGFILAFSFSAVTFVVAVVFLLLIHLPHRTFVAEQNLSFWRDLAAGFHYVRGSTWLWVTIGLFSIVNVFIAGAITVVFPTLAKTRFEGANSLGWLLSSMALGALLTALFVLSIKKIRWRGLIAYGSVIVCGLSLVGAALSLTLFHGMLTTFFLGASLTVFTIIWETSLQDLVPKEILGRVASIDMLCSYALLPLGYLFLGEFVMEFGLDHVLLSCGWLTVILAALGFFVRDVRALD